jgi:hypothetical protein
MDFDSLAIVRPVARCVKLVEYNGQYAYKYITLEDRQWTFETGFNGYLKIRGCACVPELIRSPWSGTRGEFGDFSEECCKENLLSTFGTQPIDAIYILSQDNLGIVDK